MLENWYVITFCDGGMTKTTAYTISLAIVGIEIPAGTRIVRIEEDQ